MCFHTMHCDDRPPVPECWDHDLLGAYAYCFALGSINGCKLMCMAAAASRNYLSDGCLEVFEKLDRFWDVPAVAQIFA